MSNFMNAQQMAAMQQAQMQQAQMMQQQGAGQPGAYPQQGMYAQPGVPAQYGAPGAYPQQGVYAQPAAPGAYAAAPAPPAAAAPAAQPMMGGQTVIAVNFSDGTMVGYDKLRRQMLVTGMTGGAPSTMTLPQIPARPTVATTAEGMIESGAMAIAEEVPPEPVRKEGKMVKLGFKKGPLGSESWQPRYFKLEAQTLSYHKGESASAINTIKLTSGATCRVVMSGERARKDRFEDNETSVGSMLTQPIGAMMDLYGKPIGKDNCVELHTPVQIGNMMGAITGNSALGLAYGGGMKDVKNARQRTYYLQCSSRQEADEWAEAINNNIKALPEQDMTGGVRTQAAGVTGMNVDWKKVDGLMNHAQKMQRDAELMKDPATSLQWYKTYLGGSAPIEEIYNGLMNFYDQLDANRVPHN